MVFPGAVNPKAALFRLLTHPLTITGSVVGTAFLAYLTTQSFQSGKPYKLPDLAGRTYIVTGANDGIGRALTKALAQEGARVVMACRDKKKCVEARRDIVLATRNRDVFCRVCDMSDFDSIRQFASKLINGKTKVDRIDGIVHNAATIEPKRKTNADGIELTLATNYLGPFLLTGLLLQKLLDQPHQTRIVFMNTNSAGADRITIENFCALNSGKFTRRYRGRKLDENAGRYAGNEQYVYTKALELAFSRELAERLKDSNVRVLSADPGWTGTKLEKRVTPSFIYWTFSWFLRSPAFAHKPATFALVDPDAGPGTFIGRDLNVQPWGKNADNAEFRQRAWQFAARWTRLGEQAAKLINEAKLDKDYYSHGGIGVAGSRPSSSSFTEFTQPSGTRSRVAWGDKQRSAHPDHRGESVSPCDGDSPNKANDALGHSKATEVSDSAVVLNFMQDSFKPNASASLQSGSTLESSSSPQGSSKFHWLF